MELEEEEATNDDNSFDHDSGCLVDLRDLSHGDPSHRAGQ